MQDYRYYPWQLGSHDRTLVASPDRQESMPGSIERMLNSARYQFCPTQEMENGQNWPHL
jgi:hypothetical protein